MKLTILALPDIEHQDSGVLPHVVIKHKVTLPVFSSEGNIIGRPVVMKTGFTIPYRSMVQVRSQVIVIATDDWQVLCYNPKLELVWRTSLMPAEMLTEAYVVKAMEVLVTTHSVKKNDEGLIIVGGSMMHKKHLQEFLELQQNSNVTLDPPDPGHFSTFALSGKNGSRRWHHLPGDFGEQQQDTKARPFNSSQKVEGGEFHWKLGLRANRLHKGEVSWKFYKDNMKSQMPHVWHSIEDTKFKLARFQRDSQYVDASTDEEEDSPSEPSVALKPEHIVGYAYGGHRPHNADEHVENPNVIVIHRENGLEVLSLLSGRPMTRQQFMPDSSIHLDIDGDSEPEKITWGQYPDHTVCYLDIWRQHPMKEKLDQLQVCVTKRMVWTRSWALDEDFYKKLPPFVTPSISKRKGLVSHLLGYHLAADSGYDIVSVSSLGRVSSFDIEGNIHWQAETEAAWLSMAINARKDKTREETSTKEFFDSFMPSRIPMSIKVYGRKDALAVAGYSAIAVVDLVEGTILAEHSVPAPSIAPLVIGDFNNDGLNDVVLTCKMGYIGFVMQSQTNHWYTAMYAAAVFLSIFLVTLCMSPDAWTKSEEDEE